MVYAPSTIWHASAQAFAVSSYSQAGF